MDDWEYSEDDTNPRPEVIESADGRWDVWVWSAWLDDMTLYRSCESWDEAMDVARELEETQEPDVEPVWEFEGGGALWA